MVPSTESLGCLEVELPPELESVVAARRMLSDAVRSWGLDPSVGEDAALAVSELVTNAILHAGTNITLSLRRLGPGVRVEVGDGSTHLPVVDAARPEDLLANRSMTGRGLALVAAMSDRWGADPAVSGKITWAEIGTGTRIVESSPAPLFPPTPPATKLNEASLAAGVVATWAVTGGGRRVQLIGVPVRLLLESTRQLADLQREMQVMAMDHGAAEELGEVVEAGRPLTLALDMWAESDRSVAEIAMARGDERLDWELTVPDDAADLIDRIMSWFRRSSTLVRRQLLSLPASDEVTAYRTWYRDEILWQLSGRSPRPCPLEVPSASR
jgi:anti-sigma regulatory factor (Ser/Thr protein kinase)